MAGGIFLPEDFPPLPPSFQANKSLQNSMSISFGSRPPPTLDLDQEKEQPISESSSPPLTNNKGDKSDSGQDYVKRPTNATNLQSNQKPKLPDLENLPPPPTAAHSKLPGLIEKAYQEYSTEVIDTPHIVFPNSIKAKLLSKVKYVLVAKFSHGKPSYNDFQIFLNRLNLSCHIALFDPKHIFLYFECFEDYASLWMKKVCVINGFKARIFNWWEGFVPGLESKLAPVWVQLYGLPIYFFEQEVIIQIASSLGKPLMIDPRNLSKDKADCLNFCVAMDVSIQSPTEVVIDFVEDGKIQDTFTQKVHYANKPFYCRNCYHLGHHLGVCKKLDAKDKRENADPKQDVKTYRQEGTSSSGLQINTGQAHVSATDIPMPKLAVEREDSFGKPDRMLKATSSEILDTNTLPSQNSAEGSRTASTSKASVPKKASAGIYESSNGKKYSKNPGARTTAADICKLQGDEAARTPTATKNKSTPTVSATTGTKKVQNPPHATPTSPSWHDSAEKNLPMDFSTPPFQDDVLVEEVYESSEEEEVRPREVLKKLRNPDGIMPAQKSLEPVNATDSLDVIHNHVIECVSGGSLGQELAGEMTPTKTEVRSCANNKAGETKSQENEDSNVEDYQENESSEEGEFQSSDEEQDLQQTLEKFEKVSKDLSSTKNTRITCKKHGWDTTERWCFSEEEVAEENPVDLNFDPLMGRDGEVARYSRLLESRAKLVCQRSVSPVGRSSTKLKYLQMKSKYLELEKKFAILMPTAKYERTQQIKDTRKISNTTEEWITPKRRGRPPKRQNNPNSKSRKTSPPKALEPRKRGRPRKKM